MSKVSKEHKFYLIREDVLPESVHKTIRAKELLDTHPNMPILEAVKAVNLSRSAFYKYKDTIFPIASLEFDSYITLILHIQDKPGILSEILKLISELNGDILTIHQTVPMKEQATVTISLKTTKMEQSIDGLVNLLSELSDVIKVELLGLSF